ncbi:MAG: ATP-binding cassette domain-containing protein [Planctomycetota bacterium]
MTLTLRLQHDVHTQAKPTDRAMQTAVMFGLPLDGTATHTVIPPIELTLSPGQLVFVTGVSGGGKSTLLRLIAQAIEGQAPDEAPALVLGDQLPALEDAALVDALATPEGGTSAAMPHAELKQVTHWLSMAGLNDAAVMLRSPNQLSEGQHHRLRLAQAMATAQRSTASWSVLLLDEFGSTLDRFTAAALARSVRRWVGRSNVSAVLATTHDDLLEPLAPDLLVELTPGGQCQVHHRS